MNTAQVVTEESRQIVHLPDEFRIDGNEVSVHRVGRSLLLIPLDSDRWRMLLDSLDQFTGDYMREREQPAGQDRGPLFQ